MVAISSHRLEGSRFALNAGAGNFSVGETGEQSPCAPLLQCDRVPAAAITIAAPGERSANKAPKSVAIWLPGRITAAGMLAGPLSVEPVEYPWGL
jgi:hypothetical protein